MAKLTAEQKAEMVRALYDEGMFEPTLFLLRDEEIIGRFCLNDEATAVAVEKCNERRSR